VVKFKELFSVLYTQALKKKNCKQNTKCFIPVQNVCGRNFPCNEVFPVYVHGAATTATGRLLKCLLFVTNFNENWRFENFIVTSQYTITRKLFKQLSSCYMQTDLRTEKVKIINEFLYVFAENVSKFSGKLDTRNLLTLFGNYRQVFPLRMLRVSKIVY